MRIDFHTHILPGMDDGAQSVTEALKMLEMLKQDEIELAALTPHYYRDEMTVEQFISTRETAYQALMEAYEKDSLPKLMLGCECTMWKGMNSVDLFPLCIADTNMLICEMPYSYQSYIPDELEELIACGYLPVIAHLDRYFKLYPKDKLDCIIKKEGLIFQINTHSLSSLGVRLKLASMAKRGSSFILGSDCHDIANRPPVIKRAALKKRSLKKDFIPSVLHNEELFFNSSEQ